VIALAAGVALVLTLAYAAPFGSLNQATYLLDPLQRAQPELFTRDWFVSETPTYMRGFGWLAQWLFVIDPEGPLAFSAAHVVINVATYAAIYALVTALCGGWRAFVIVAVFVTLTRGFSMGGSYLLVGYLQPSSLATLGWIAALAAFVRARYLMSGIAAALAGAVHPNFLVLGVGIFTLAGLARRELTLRDHAALLVPQLIVLACFVPELAGAAGPSDRALWILSELHAPGHYSPQRLIYWVPAVLCWQVAACSAMLVLDNAGPARALWRFSLLAAAIACTTALLTQLAPLLFLVQLFTARLAPFAQLACIALVTTALVRQATTPKPLTRLQRVMFATGLVAPLLVASWFWPFVLSGPAIAIGCILVLAIALAPLPVARVALTCLIAVTLAFTLWSTPTGRGITTQPHGETYELELEDWARTRTKVDALFLIPPELGRFRLLARRAVVVDTKSPPLRPDLLEQWYRRLCAATRVEHEGPTSHQIDALYAALSQPELEQIARAFRADYIVVAATVPFTKPPVFHNRAFNVYRVTP
jgi:hypothetical protein